MFINDMEFYTEIDDDLFMRTVFSFEVEEEEVKDLQRNYSVINKKTLASIEEASQKAYQKKVSQPRTVVEWTLEDFRETEASLLDFNE